MIVCKFGGSSVSSYEKLNIIKEIISNDEKRKIIIISAIGKESDTDCKMTDLLIELAKIKKLATKCEIQLNIIENKFLTIIDKTDYYPLFKKEFESFKKNVAKLSDNFIVSRGEYFTAKAVASYLGITFCDSANFLTFDKNNFNLYKSYIKYRMLNVDKKIVVPGFYGKNTNGEITLFKRGGGDISGSLLAKFSNAILYENYTDVDGVFSVNPTLNKCATKIEELSFFQCYNIAKSGSTMLADDCVLQSFLINTPIKLINLKTKKSTLISSKTCDNFINLSLTENLVLYKFCNLKNIQKYRFISYIIGIFMLDNIIIERIKYTSQILYIISNQSEFLEEKINKHEMFLSLNKISKITIYGNKNLVHFKNKLKKDPTLFLTKFSKLNNSIVTYSSSAKKFIKNFNIAK